MKVLEPLFWLFLSLIGAGVALSDDHSLVPSLIHGVLLPLELLHLLWAAVTGEFGPAVCVGTWLGLAWVAIMLIEREQPSFPRKEPRARVHLPMS
jgi:hypothetical protein